jgi:competence protein ComEC
MKALLFLLLFTLSVTARDKTFDIYWIDSEGGGSTLVVTPASESVLIDTGNPGGRDPQRIHALATKKAGLTRLDHVIITHFHIDHFGGLAELAELMPIARCMIKACLKEAQTAKPMTCAGRWPAAPISPPRSRNAAR